MWRWRCDGTADKVIRFHNDTHSHWVSLKISHIAGALNCILILYGNIALPEKKNLYHEYPLKTGSIDVQEYQIESRLPYINVDKSSVVSDQVVPVTLKACAT